MRHLAATRRRIACSCRLLRCPIIKGIRVLPPVEFILHILVLVAAGILAQPSFSQAPKRGATTQVIPPQVEQLIREAKAADSPEGNYKYSSDLTKLLVLHPTSKSHVDVLSDRLSKADLMARRGERNWIPESVVVQAYNDLLKEIGAPPGKPPQADTNVVHQLRITLSEVSPAFSSVNSQASSCLPSEAVQLLVQLLLHSGSIEGPCLPNRKPVTAPTQQSCSDVDVSLLMHRYFRSHSASQQEKLFDHAAKRLGI